MRLPAGWSSADFTSAVAQFEQAVGKAWVFTRDEDVDLYRDAFSPFRGEPEESWSPPRWLRPRREMQQIDASQSLQGPALSDIDR